MSSLADQALVGHGDTPSQSDDAPALGESDAGPQCPGYSMEAGFDYTGGDIGQGSQSVSDASACCSLCESTQLCNVHLCGRDQRLLAQVSPQGRAGAAE